jgi:DNA polymerase III epsilon subunit
MREDNTLIVLDVETTGLDFLREKIIEFAAVKLVNGEITEEFQTLINPEQEIRHSSIKIHGITQEMVENQPTMAEVLPQIADFIQNYDIIGHNVIFDFNFLNQAYLKYFEKPLTNHRIDTQYLFREVFPEEFSHGLGALLKRFDVEPNERHRAMADAKYLAMVYTQLKALYDKKYEWQLSQMNNVEYLFERYVRIQQAVQTMQAELSDIKSIFKIYFEQGGEPIESTTGERLLQTSKVQYDYDFEILKPVIAELNAEKRAFKLNSGLIDRMIDGISLDEEIKLRLSSARTKVSETKIVTIQKPDKYLQDFAD